MKIAIAQMEVIPKQIKSNYERMKKHIEAAKASGVEILVFGELTLSGYQLGDVIFSQRFIKECQIYNEKIISLAQDIVLVWSNLTYIDKNLKDIGVGAFVAQNQKLVARENSKSNIYFKQVFNDQRYYKDSRYFKTVNENPSELSPFIIKLHNQELRLGLGIGSDFKSESQSEALLKGWQAQNLDVLIHLDSEPYVKTIQRKNEFLMELLVKYPVSLFVYANIVGMQNTGKNVIIYNGGSFICDQHITKLAIANHSFEEALLQIGDIDLSHPSLFDALTYSVYAFDKAFFSESTKWVVGLSGGLDSSISVALLARALNPKRVLTYNLPSKYNSPITINNAQITAQSLGVSYQEISIEQLVEATQSTLGLDPNQADLIVENIQARIRGHVLSTIAAKENGVIISNGNKVEVAIGYATLYGDTIGALAPLGDCNKVDVFELAQSINDYYQQVVIPANLIPYEDEKGYHFGFAPSAELNKNQVDPMKWGYHDYLIDKLLEKPTYAIESWIEQVKTQYFIDPIFHKWLTIYQLNDMEAFINDLQWLIRLLQLAIFKRIQMPPIVLVSESGFGSDFLESQGFLNIDWEKLLEGVDDAL